MPKRRFADLLSDLLKFGAVIYFLSQCALLILGVAGGRFDIGGLIGAVVFTTVLFTLGVLLDVLISIERAIYELLAALKRPRN